MPTPVSMRKGISEATWLARSKALQKAQENRNKSKPQLASGPKERYIPSRSDKKATKWDTLNFMAKVSATFLSASFGVMGVGLAGLALGTVASPLILGLGAVAGGAAIQGIYRNTKTNLTMAEAKEARSTSRFQSDDRQTEFRPTRDGKLHLTDGNINYAPDGSSFSWNITDDMVLERNGKVTLNKYLD